MTNSREGKSLSSVPQAKGFASPVRQNMFPVREQHIPPARELPLSPVSEASLQ